MFDNAPSINRKVSSLLSPTKYNYDLLILNLAEPLRAPWYTRFYRDQLCPLTIEQAMTTTRTLTRNPSPRQRSSTSQSEGPVSAMLPMRHLANLAGVLSEVIVVDAVGGAEGFLAMKTVRVRYVQLGLHWP